MMGLNSWDVLLAKNFSYFLGFNLSSWGSFAVKNDIYVAVELSSTYKMMISFVGNYCLC